MGLPAAAMPIVWVAFSGRSDVTATLVGTFALLLAFETITIYSEQFALILMGSVLLATVLFMPTGLMVEVGRLIQRLHARATGHTKRVV